MSPVLDMAPMAFPDDRNSLPMKMENPRRIRSSTTGLTKSMGSCIFSTCSNQRSHVREFPRHTSPTSWPTNHRSHMTFSPDLIDPAMPTTICDMFAHGLRPLNVLWDSPIPLTPPFGFLIVIGWESSSLYTCDTILCSVHYMIHYSAISKTITAHYQSTVSMISFAQV